MKNAMIKYTHFEQVLCSLCYGILWYLPLLQVLLACYVRKAWKVPHNLPSRSLQCTEPSGP